MKLKGANNLCHSYNKRIVVGNDEDTITAKIGDNVICDKCAGIPAKIDVADHLIFAMADM